MAKPLGERSIEDPRGFIPEHVEGFHNGGNFSYILEEVPEIGHINHKEQSSKTERWFVSSLKGIPINGEIIYSSSGKLNEISQRVLIADAYPDGDFFKSKPMVTEYYGLKIDDISTIRNSPIFYSGPSFTNFDDDTTTIREMASTKGISVDILVPTDSTPDQYLKYLTNFEFSAGEDYKKSVYGIYRKACSSEIRFTSQYPLMYKKYFDLDGYKIYPTVDTNMVGVSDSEDGGFYLSKFINEYISKENRQLYNIYKSLTLESLNPSHRTNDISFINRYNSTSLNPYYIHCGARLYDQYVLNSDASYPNGIPKYERYSLALKNTGAYNDFDGSYINDFYTGDGYTSKEPYNSPACTRNGNTTFLFGYKNGNCRLNINDIRLGEIKINTVGNKKLFYNLLSSPSINTSYAPYIFNILFDNTFINIKELDNKIDYPISKYITLTDRGVNPYDIIHVQNTGYSETFSNDFRVYNYAYHQMFTILKTSDDYLISNNFISEAGEYLGAPSKGRAILYENYLHRWGSLNKPIYKAFCQPDGNCNWYYPMEFNSTGNINRNNDFRSKYDNSIQSDRLFNNKSPHFINKQNTTPGFRMISTFNMNNVSMPGLYNIDCGNFIDTFNKVYEIVKFEY